MRWLLYPLYEWHLLRAVSDLPMPNHVGIILDGNRRYARQRGLTETHEIYGLGARKLDELLDWCNEPRIRAVTLWVCSTENLRRSPDEVSGIPAAIEAKLGALTDDPAIHHRHARVRAAGKLGLLPESTAAVIRTSGEIRLSGFLLWQSAFIELYFSDVHWPEFRKIDFPRAIRTFQQRRR